MAEISLQSISHSYVTGEPVYVLRDIELLWRDGGAYALLGPSGCGKTTLLNIISGLIRPSRGRVLYNDSDVTALPTRQRNIAQVFQFPVIYDTMTVFENLAFPLKNRKIAPAEVSRRVKHIAELLELTPVLKTRATRLTPDLKQIISLGRGLVRDDVAAILFDEPLTVIDPHRKWVLRRKLRAIHREFGHTLIYVTHDQTEALTFADQVVVMHEGDVLQQGTPEELFARPAHTQVGYFIGSPGMCFLPCEVAGQSITVAGHPVASLAELGTGAGDPGDALGGQLTLGIRPEHVALVAQGSERSLPARIDFVEDHGRFCIASGAVSEHSIKIKVAGDRRVTAGEAAWLHFPPEHVCVYRDSRLVASAPRAGQGGAS